MPLPEAMVRAAKEHRFQKGVVTSRISAKVQRAIRLARGGCPDAVLYCIRVLKDEEETTEIRLKAAKVILDQGMPRGDRTKYYGEEQVGAITLNLVLPTKDGLPPVEPPLLTLDTVPEGTAD